MLDVRKVRDSSSLPSTMKTPAFRQEFFVYALIRCVFYEYGAFYYQTLEKQDLL